MFLANFLIALREGLEAALIVSILVAYLVKTGHREMLRPLWIGIGIAVAIPLALGAAMTWGPKTLSFQAQEIIGGSLSFIAVAMVTWMIMWMGRNSRTLSQGLKSEMGAAIATGSASSVVWIAVVSVGREGIETAVFIWAVTRSAAMTSVWLPVLGVVSGLAVAIILGLLMYRGALRINLHRFFTITGLFLIFVAAGVVAYGIGDFQEAGVIPGWGVTVYDYSAMIDPNNIFFVLLEAIFNFNLAPTWAQLIGWLAYLVVVLPVFFVVSAPKKEPKPISSAPSTANVADDAAQAEQMTRDPSAKSATTAATAGQTALPPNQQEAPAGDYVVSAESAPAGSTEERKPSK